MDIRKESSEKFWKRIFLKKICLVEIEEHKKGKILQSLFTKMNNGGSVEENKYCEKKDGTTKKKSV